VGAVRPHNESDLYALSEQVGTLTPSTDDEITRARAYAAAHAHDADDLRDLLGALGLETP
jgi:hypothetical protein